MAAGDVIVSCPIAADGARLAHRATLGRGDPAECSSPTDLRPNFPSDFKPNRSHVLTHFVRSYPHFVRIPGPCEALPAVALRIG